MELRQAGFGLYNLLFPRSPMTFGAQKARAALERCLSRGLASDPFAPGEPPSLFVRLLARSPKIRDVILPLGILAVGDTSATAKFLGFHYRIETPLDDQSYSAPGPCIDRWFLLVPSLDLKDPDLRSARERLGPWISEWESGAERSFQEMSDFQPWIERLGAETAPSALLVLSHHSDNRLSFGANGQSLSLNFARSFARPSLAVLNGCGTGGPGGAELIRKVNELGMMAVVATSTEVYPKMAGDFMNCLAQVLRDAPGTTIGTTYFDALRCLHGKAPQEKGKTYGAHVLAYTLLGNGNLKLCRPRKGDL
jgi:hypothetical protein